MSRFEPYRVVLSAAAVCALASCGSDSTPNPDVATSSQDPNGPASSDPGHVPGTPPDVDPGPGGPPQVLLVGRFETTDPAGPKASWPGARIATRFAGTTVSATMREYAADWMDGAPSFWDVRVDGAPAKILEMIPDDAPHVFELAAGLPAGEHEVELYKRSEMQTGITQFLGFDFHGGRSLAAPTAKPRHIEAMADSYGTGYGIVQLNAPNLECGVNHAGRWQNFREAWPARLGERFGAEVEGTVYSGKGLTRGIWPTDTDGLADYYGRANPNPAMAGSNPQPFDLKSWPPDVIVMVQGTVDHGMGDFRDLYRDFVRDQLRARAPNAHIFLVVPGNVGRDKWISVVNSVAEELTVAGDTKVYPVIPNGEQPDEMTACGFHGSPTFHERVANEIGAVIAAKTGW